MSHKSNPWLDAAGKETWSSNALRVEPSILRPVAGQAEEARRRVPRLQSLLRTLHVVDGILGVILLIYGLSVTSKNVRTFSILTTLCGVLLLIRASAGLLSLATTDLCPYCGLVMSAYLSILFVFILLLLSILFLGVHTAFFTYLENHASQLHLSEALLQFLDRYHHALSLTLLAFAFFEILRFIFLRRWQQQQLQLEQEELQLSMAPIVRRRQPWWWQKRSLNEQDLEGPLLGRSPHWAGTDNRSYIVDEGINRDATRDSSFWSRLWNRNSVVSNARDDTSVDFASVQEEWASRSEEDPFWWSREEDEGVISTNSNGVNDPTWAKDGNETTEVDSEKY